MIRVRWRIVAIRWDPAMERLTLQRTR